MMIVLNTYLCREFSHLSEAKLKEGIFIDVRFSLHTRDEYRGKKV